MKTNANTFTDYSPIIKRAMDVAICSGDFNYAECAVSAGAWTTEIGIDYVVSKSIGSIPLQLQAMLRDYLVGFIRLEFLC